MELKNRERLRLRQPRNGRVGVRVGTLGRLAAPLFGGSLFPGGSSRPTPLTSIPQSAEYGGETISDGTCVQPDPQSRPGQQDKYRGNAEERDGREPERPYTGATEGDAT